MNVAQLFRQVVFALALCTVFFHRGVSQDNIPSIIKAIQDGVLLIVTYSESGKELKIGCGFFIDGNGVAVTNRHILAGATQAEARTSDGMFYPIKKIIAEDKQCDLLKILVDIPQNQVHPLIINTVPVEVGEKVVVIGSLLFPGQTILDGIISGTQDIPNFGSVIRITVPLSDSLSGGPVVNFKGEVIGVATFGVTEGQNLNFIVPVERVTQLPSGMGINLSEWMKNTMGKKPESVEQQSKKEKDVLSLKKRLNGHTSSLSFGYSENDFRYVDKEAPAIYDFHGSFPMFMLAWKSLMLNIGYGTQPASLSLPSLNMLEAALSTGGKITLFRSIAGLQLEAGLPIRVTYRHRLLSTGHETRPTELPRLNLSNLEFGGGISAMFRLKPESRYVVSFSIFSSMGALTQWERVSSDNICVSRSTDVNIEAKAERLLLNRIGLTVGYTFVSQRWTDRSPESSKEVFESILNTDKIPKRWGQGIFRIGINW
jgi:hypothetical protein